MSKGFTAQDCNMWLVQVSTARSWVMQYFADYDPFDPYDQYKKSLTMQEVASGAALGLSLITFIIMLFLACCKGGLGHMHGILFFWILAQAPFTLLTFAFYGESQDNFLSYNYATDQFMLMGLLTTISMSITHFKRHHLLHVDHANIRFRLEAGVARDRRFSCIFFLANFLFQIPLFIVQNYHYYTLWHESFKKAPQPQNSIISGFAIVIGLLIILFIITYLVMMIARMPSMFMLINHSVHNRLGRMLLFTITPFLVILYINDVFSVMLYYWGAPAGIMTKWTGYQWQGEYNDDFGCRSLLTTAIDFYSKGKLTSFGGFLRLIFTISQVTPLIWTVVLSVGFLSMICTQRKPRKDVHDENEQQRANLVQNNYDINATSQTQNGMWNSSQTTERYSINQMV